ncbi:ribosomal RNA methyltransferase, putative [Plasmodium relictum]|uniref:Putative tRNA (cytidine(32)/guanosine(34)-2'-O)-methyltransferase n=1 Tax=Plasmodium relictum TaxID=85471 RepID=A0A1J1H3H0_PLARL|nr:ribosomal RNA methyltransferase, putative [Plasmodium relictum]CRG99296.1 ribosomal RNA methyltransferase, putative [Plasmodium relictum]
MGKLSKDRRDIYYRKAKENGYRARSSYKLIQINEKFEIFKLFDPNMYNKNENALINIYNENFCYNIVDLCAAPGSWSQVLKNICLYNYYQILYFINKKNYDSNEEKLRHLENKEFIENFSLYINNNDTLESKISNLKKDKSIKEPKIIAVDLQEIGNMNYVHIIQGDITKMSTIDKILKCMNSKDEMNNEESIKCEYDNNKSLNNKILNKTTTPNSFSYANTVVCDGAPDITGMNDIDEFIQSQLILSSLKVCCSILKIGGNFISKIFRGEHTGLLVLHLNKFFEKIYICKPQSSRNKSLEAFLVCLNFSLPLSNIIALSDHNKKKSFNNKNFTHEQIRKMHTLFITKKDDEKKINNSKDDKKKNTKGNSEMYDEKDNQRNKYKKDENEDEDDNEDENKYEDEDEDEDKDEYECEYEGEIGDIIESEDEDEDEDEGENENNDLITREFRKNKNEDSEKGNTEIKIRDENKNKENYDKYNVIYDKFTINNEASCANSTKGIEKNENMPSITELEVDEDTVNILGNKNIDIFNFYCSDSDEEIKYFNSEDEEIVNDYIASENFMNNKLFSFVTTKNYYDSDKSYLLPQNYIRHEPQLMPLKPPYLLSLQKKRQETKKL